MTAQVGCRLRGVESLVGMAGALFRHGGHFTVVPYVLYCTIAIGLEGTPGTAGTPLTPGTPVREDSNLAGAEVMIRRWFADARNSGVTHVHVHVHVPTNFRWMLLLDFFGDFDVSHGMNIT